jgi:hypothetical protein
VLVSFAALLEKSFDNESFGWCFVAWSVARMIRVASLAARMSRIRLRRQNSHPPPLRQLLLVTFLR